MAEDPKAASGGQGGSSVVTRLIVIGGIVLVCATAGLLVFNFVLRPMLTAPEEVEAAEPPPSSIFFEFPDSQVTVIADSPDEAAPILIFKVTFACANPETSAALGANQPRFEAMVNELHQFRTRQELNDPYVKETIVKQIKQKANDILKRLDPSGTLQVTDVFHVKYTMYDL